MNAGLRAKRPTSANGNRYLSGWLGKASIVAFLDEQPDKFGNPCWSVFVSTPEPRPEQQAFPLERPVLAGENAEPLAPPAARADGWRGSQYRRPANGTRRVPTAEPEPFPDDNLADLYR